MVAEREFSREIEIARVPVGGRPFAIAAEASERVALARRLGLERIDRLRAEGTLLRTPGEPLLVLEGRLEAEVTQRCVVTLEPVASRLEVELHRIFALGRAPQEDEIVVDPLREEPEPLEGEVLDLGEIAAEELALAVDPYPRAPGAGLAEAGPDAAEESEPEARRVLANGRGGRP